MEPSTPSSARKKTLMEAVCERLPNCSRALELAETGIERDLSATEKIALAYHGRLCPFCGCAAGKYTATRNRMKDAQRDRQSS